MTARADRSAELAALIAPYLPVADAQGQTESDALALAFAVDDPGACRMIAAFSRITLPKWRRPRGRRPTDARERWLWIWTGYLGGPDEPEFLDELARRAGVTRRAATRLWASLVSSRLVYPDGAISEDATTLIRLRVTSNLPTVPAVELENRQLRAEVSQLRRDVIAARAWPKVTR